MARIRFTILGCGASPGVPRIDGDWGACDPAERRNRRSRCAALVERLGAGERPTRLVIDTGPDIRCQLLAAGVAALDGVLYTHAHADHLHGIDDLRAFWLTSRRLLPVYADDITHARVMQAFGYCFETPPGGSYPPILERRRIEAGTAFAVDGPGGAITVLPFRQIHGDIETLGVRVGGIAYSCDISDLPEESFSAVQHLDAWVVDALRHRPHPSHFSVEEAVGWSRRFTPRRTVLTHMHADLDYRRLAAELPAGFEPAFDGMVLETAD